MQEKETRVSLVRRLQNLRFCKRRVQGSGDVSGLNSGILNPYTRLSPWFCKSL
jgi:hypothetical protein